MHGNFEGGEIFIGLKYFHFTGKLNCSLIGRRGGGVGGKEGREGGREEGVGGREGGSGETGSVRVRACVR